MDMIYWKRLKPDEIYTYRLQQEILKHWKCYVDHKIYSKKMKHKTDYFYQMKLKQKLINALLRNLTMKRQNELACKILSQLYKRLLILDVWNKWILMIESNRDVDSRINYLRAKELYNKKILTKSFSFWLRYSKYRYKKKEMEWKAKDFCEVLYFKKCVIVWKDMFDERKQDRALEQKAIDFYNDLVTHTFIQQWRRVCNRTLCLIAMWKQATAYYKKKLLSKYFTDWIKFCNDKIQRDNTMKEAEEYYDTNLLRKYFKMLSMHVAKANSNKAMLYVVNDFYRKKLLRKIILFWKTYYQKSLEYATKIKELRQSREDRLKQKVLYHWQIYIVHKKCANRKIFLSSNHFKKRLMIRTFVKLKSYLKYRKEKRIRLNPLKNQIEKDHLRIQRMYLERWRAALITVAQQRSKIFKAAIFHSNRLTQKYFNFWTRFVKQHRERVILKINLQSTVQCILLKKYTSLWYTNYQRVAEIRMKEKWISSVYEGKLKYKYFAFWVRYIQEETTKKHEIEAAKEFYKKLALKEGLKHIFRTCLEKAEFRYENQLKNTTKRVSENFDILRYFFNKWLLVTEFKNCPRFKMNDKIITNTTPTIFADGEPVHRDHLIIPEFMKDDYIFSCSNTRIKQSDRIHRDAEDTRKIKMYPVNIDEVPMKIYNVKNISVLPNKESYNSLMDEAMTKKEDLEARKSSNLDIRKKGSLPKNWQWIESKQFRVQDNMQLENVNHINDITETKNFSSSSNSSKGDLDTSRTYSVKSPVIFDKSARFNSSGQI